MRVTLFICWILLLLTFRNSVANKNVLFLDASQANFKVASISDSVFAVSIYNAFEYGLSVTFETQLIRFSKIPIFATFSSRKGGINCNQAIPQSKFLFINNSCFIDILSALRMEKYSTNTISVFRYVSATAHFYTPI
jgi:hypothetical protein